MRLFHVHDWKEESSSYSPSKASFEGSGLSSKEIKALTEGVTNVYLRCSGCGDIKCVRMFGKYEPKR